tara:strand:- start:15180 stop:15479 length:300 start_codon:yes stop_codon:yes gene_type:complete
MEYNTDVEYENLNFSNPNIDSPEAKLLQAILLNAVHDSVAAQSTEKDRRLAWDWIEQDDCLIHYCLSVVNVDRERLTNRLKYMRDNKINLKNMYTIRRD